MTVLGKVVDDIADGGGWLGLTFGSLAALCIMVVCASLAVAQWAPYGPPTPQDCRTACWPRPADRWSQTDERTECTCRP